MHMCYIYNKLNCVLVPRSRVLLVETFLDINTYVPNNTFVCVLESLVPSGRLPPDWMILQKACQLRTFGLW